MSRNSQQIQSPTLLSSRDDARHEGPDAESFLPQSGNSSTCSGPTDMRTSRKDTVSVNTNPFDLNEERWPVKDVAGTPDNHKDSELRNFLKTKKTSPHILGATSSGHRSGSAHAPQHEKFCDNDDQTQRGLDVNGMKPCDNASHMRTGSEAPANSAIDSQATISVAASDAHVRYANIEDMLKHQPSEGYLASSPPASMTSIHDRVTIRTDGGNSTEPQPDSDFPWDPDALDSEEETPTDTREQPTSPVVGALRRREQRQLTNNKRQLTPTGSPLGEMPGTRAERKRRRRGSDGEHPDGVVVATEMLYPVTGSPS